MADESDDSDAGVQRGIIALMAHQEALAIGDEYFLEDVDEQDTPGAADQQSQANSDDDQDDQEAEPPFVTEFVTADEAVMRDRVELDSDGDSLYDGVPEPAPRTLLWNNEYQDLVRHGEQAEVNARGPNQSITWDVFRNIHEHGRSEELFSQTEGAPQGDDPYNVMDLYTIDELRYACVAGLEIDPQPSPSMVPWAMDIDWPAFVHPEYLGAGDIDLQSLRSHALGVPAVQQIDQDFCPEVGTGGYPRGIDQRPPTGIHQGANWPPQPAIGRGSSAAQRPSGDAPVLQMPYPSAHPALTQAFPASGRLSTSRQPPVANPTAPVQNNSILSRSVPMPQPAIVTATKKVGYEALESFEFLGSDRVYDTRLRLSPDVEFQGLPPLYAQDSTKAFLCRGRCRRLFPNFRKWEEHDGCHRWICAKCRRTYCRRINVRKHKPGGPKCSRPS